MIERIQYIKNSNGNTLAIISRREHRAEDVGVKFLTQGSDALQLAHMLRKAGEVIPRHKHLPIHRKTHLPTAEVIIVRKGYVRVDVYDAVDNFVETIALGDMDVFLQLEGGHQFTIGGSGADIVEVKTGPYAGDKDKAQF